MFVFPLVQNVWTVTGPQPEACECFPVAPTKIDRHYRLIRAQLWDQPLCDPQDAQRSRPREIIQFVYCTPPVPCKSIQNPFTFPHFVLFTRMFMCVVHNVCMQAKKKKKSLQSQLLLFWFSFLLFCKCFYQHSHLHTAIFAHSSLWNRSSRVRSDGEFLWTAVFKPRHRFSVGFRSRLCLGRSTTWICKPVHCSSGWVFSCLSCWKLNFRPGLKTAFPSGLPCILAVAVWAFLDHFDLNF